ncbi:MAG: transposase [Rhodopseudomonas palustris]|nr:transposase [Rhodopseudomonas palustris]
MVVPNVPHHVTQRGNRRMPVFFREEDYREYLALLNEYTVKAKAEIVAFCLMPTHVHLIVVPRDEASLTGAIQEVHRRYSRMINFRENWRGHLWQGRYASFPLDKAHLFAAVRYIEWNPVRARLALNPEDWPYSSARHHLGIEESELIRRDRFGESISDWRSFLMEGIGDDEIGLIRRHEGSGRPLGDEKFLKRCEKKLGRDLHPGKPGPKPKEKKR